MDFGLGARNAGAEPFSWCRVLRRPQLVLEIVVVGDDDDLAAREGRVR
jgi:hypothetical protein